MATSDYLPVIQILKKGNHRQLFVVPFFEDLDDWDHNMCPHKHTHTHLHVCMCNHTCPHKRKQKHAHIWMFTQTHMCVPTSINTHMYACPHKHTHYRVYSSLMMFYLLQVPAIVLGVQLYCTLVKHSRYDVL